MHCLDRVADQLHLDLLVKYSDEILAASIACTLVRRTSTPSQVLASWILALRFEVTEFDHYIDTTLDAMRSAFRVYCSKEQLKRDMNDIWIGLNFSIPYRTCTRDMYNLLNTFDAYSQRTVKVWMFCLLYTKFGTYFTAEEWIECFKNRLRSNAVEHHILCVILSILPYDVKQFLVERMPRVRSKLTLCERVCHELKRALPFDTTPLTTKKLRTLKL